MEDLLKCVVNEPQTQALEELEKHKDLLDQNITIDCSTLTNHCVCAANFEYFRKPEHFIECLRKRRCFHCQRYRYMHKYHETVTSSSKLILVAAALGKFEIMKYLHQNGCSLETKSGIFEVRPLHLSIFHKHFNIFCYLLTHRVDVNSTILSHGTTYSPLMMAVIHKQDDMVRYLLMTREIDLGYRNSMCQSPVMFAVQNNNLEMMNLLLSAEEKYIALKRPTPQRNRARPRLYHPGALLEALKTDNVEVLKVLLDSGCNVNFTFHGFYIRAAAIVLTAVRNAFRCLELLLQRGADSSTEIEGFTALDWARVLGWQESISVLQSYDAPVLKTRSLVPQKLGTGESSSDHVSEYELGKNSAFNETNNFRVESTEKYHLQQQGSDGLEAKDNQKEKGKGLFPLIAIWTLAQWIDVENAIRQLVLQGENVNVQDSLGRTCLHLAVEEQSVHGVRTLLKLGADTEIRDSCLATPFWHAVYWNKESMVKELLFANVRVNTPAKENAYRLGLPWTTLSNHHEYCQDNSSVAFRSPLYIATQKNYHIIVHFLLESGYNTRAENMERLLNIAKPEAKELLEDHQQNVKSLCTLTRNFIRQQCGIKIHNLAEQMDLPFRVKDLLLLRDLMDLRVEPVFVHV